MHYITGKGVDYDLSLFTDSQKDSFERIYSVYEQVCERSKEEPNPEIYWSEYHNAFALPTEQEVETLSEDAPLKIIWGDLERNILILCGMFGEPSKGLIKHDYSRRSSKLQRATR